MITNFEQDELVAGILDKKSTKYPSLYELLKNGISDNKKVNDIMFPINTFPTGIVVNENSLTMKTEMQIPGGIEYDNRIFIPFAANGDVIEEYINGYCEIFPSYHLVVVDEKLVNGSFSIQGTYYLNDCSYSTVYINEFGRVVTSSEMKEESNEVCVERQLPTLHTPSQTEYDYVIRKYKEKANKKKFEKMLNNGEWY